MFNFLKYLKCEIVPIGALTSKSYVFGLRPWELKSYVIFDPTIEFYQPISVMLANNVIQKVLPINSGESYLYNWIPNRLRFFFESVSVLSVSNEFPAFSAPMIYRKFQRNYFTGVRTIKQTWFSVLNNLSVKYYNLFPVSNGVLITNHNLNFDLLSTFELSHLISKIPKLFSVLKFSPLKHYFHDSRFLAFSNTCNYSDVTSRFYSKIFLISFNPYFSNPMFTYYLNEAVTNRGSELYTAMFSGKFMNLKYKNIIPTYFALEKLFAGKHSWSDYLVQPTTLIVIDSLLFQALPTALVTTMLRVIVTYSDRVYLANLDKNIFNSLLVNSDFKVGSKLISNFSNICHSFFSDYDSTLQWEKIVPVGHLCTSFFSTGIDYSYLFNFDLIRFSSLNNFTLARTPIFQHWLPISAFTNFSTVYKFSFNPIPRLLDRVVVTLSRKPVGQVFRLLAERFKAATEYGFIQIPVFIMAAVIFVKFFISSLWSFEKFKMGLSSRYFFGNYLKAMKWYISSKFYFTDIQCVNFIAFRILPVRYSLELSNWCYLRYSNLDITRSRSAFINYSRTLTLERVFFITRFSNFK